MQNRPNPGETSSSVAIPSQAVALVWALPERGRELLMVIVVAMATVVHDGGGGSAHGRRSRRAGVILSTST